MFNSLYIKLIASAMVLAIVGGAWFYVHNLQSKVVTLTGENNTLRQSNKELGDNLKVQIETNNNINKVSNAGDKIREQNKIVRDNQLKGIDEKVKAGKDRPVGPLLKEFFNG
jgi:hypothetical protein